MVSPTSITKKEVEDLQYGQSNDILRFIINNGMVNISDVQNSMEAMKREEVLKKHPYKIWEGKDGKWYTYLPDEEKGRVLKKKATRKAIENDVIKYWKQETENPAMRKYLQVKGIITVIESLIKEKKKYLVSYQSSKKPN